MRPCAHAPMHPCTHAPMYQSIPPSLHYCAHTHARTYPHKCMRAHTHTSIHTFIQTSAYMDGRIHLSIVHAFVRTHACRHVCPSVCDIIIIIISTTTTSTIAYTFGALRATRHKSRDMMSTARGRIVFLTDISEHADGKHRRALRAEPSTPLSMAYAL